MRRMRRLMGSTRWFEEFGRTKKVIYAFDIFLGSGIWDHEGTGNFERHTRIYLFEDLEFKRDGKGEDEGYKN